MGLFEFFFPEWAAAEHLKTIRDMHRRARRRTAKRRLPSARNRAGMVREADVNKRIEALEEDVGFLSLLLLGILDVLSEKGAVTMEEVIGCMADLDSLDGIRDGRVNVQVLRRLYEEGAEGGDPEKGITS